ncbi:MAG: amidohydrolase family protein, partial [Gammaproteobacteria bacterium]|nr:amidohydrolase family protein [Gammaproteobacteria bacterium]
MTYDLRIDNGTIVDGTGAPSRAGSVAVRDGRIVAMGDVTGGAQQTIDAEGKVIAPGFVDIHTHYDAQVMWDRMLTISPWHGVTTVVMGNCGFGVAPTRAAHRELIVRTLEKVEGMTAAALFEGLGENWPFETFPEYLDAIDARGTAINVAALVGHTPVRLYVMGEEATEREANADEISQMREIVQAAITAGAVGFATSKAATHVGYEGRPVPSRLASREEIDALAGAVPPAGEGIMQATIGKGLGLKEFERLAKDNGIRVSWTALLAGGGLVRNSSVTEQLARSASMRAAGADVWPQVACRPIVLEFTFAEPFLLDMNPVFNKLSGADVKTRIAAYASDDFRADFERMINGGPLTDAFAGAAISYSPGQPGYEAQALPALAAEAGKSLTDFVLDLVIADDLKTRIRMPVANTDQAEVATMLRDENVVLGLSDAGAHASQLCDACFSTHLLGHWVREKQTLTLERAVQMLTSLPADIFGIADRGR